MTIWGIDVFASALVVTLMITGVLVCALLSDIVRERSTTQEERFK